MNRKPHHGLLGFLWCEPCKLFPNRVRLKNLFLVRSLPKSSLLLKCGYKLTMK